MKTKHGQSQKLVSPEKKRGQSGAEQLISKQVKTTPNQINVRANESGNTKRIIYEQQQLAHFVLFLRNATWSLLEWQLPHLHGIS